MLNPWDVVQITTNTFITFIHRYFWMLALLSPSFFCTIEKFINCSESSFFSWFSWNPLSSHFILCMHSLKTCIVWWPYGSDVCQCLKSDPDVLTKYREWNIWAVRLWGQSCLVLGLQQTLSPAEMVRAVEPAGKVRYRGGALPVLWHYQPSPGW